MRAAVTAALLCFAATAFADASGRQSRTLTFSEHGFSIEPPVGHDESRLQQVVSLYLPASDGFAPNVNVIVQPFFGTMDEFMAKSRDDFKPLGFKIVAEKHDDKAATLEYVGTFQGQSLHWYARAYRGKRGYFIATATLAEAQWTALGPTLRRSVDSLRPLP